MSPRSTESTESTESADYRDRNRRAWNHLAESGSLFAKVASDEELSQPLNALDGRGWLPKSIANLDVLCLAAGGGWQSMLYAATGARVTVVDLSDSMLRIDRQQAERRGFEVRTIQASMDDLSQLDDASFDIVHQPVSTCYVPAVEPVFQEIARVLRTDGIYISQHKQPASLQVSHRNERAQFVLGIEYYRSGPLPRQVDDAYRETGATEYLHRWEELVGGLCRAGFVIEDLCEPFRADYQVDVSHYGYRGRFIPPYVRMKARRLTTQPPRDTDRSLWLP